jgi:molybdopterin converting factor small subunit
LSVIIKTHPFLRRFLKDNEEVEVEGRTIGECLENLEGKFPGFKHQVLQDGRLRSIIEIYVNEESAYPEDLEKRVKDGDVVTFITYIGGG